MTDLWPEGGGSGGEGPAGSFGDLFEAAQGPIADKYGFVRESSPGVLIVAGPDEEGLSGFALLARRDPDEAARVERQLRAAAVAGRRVVFVLAAPFPGG